jgi:hypothetical protein
MVNAFYRETIYGTADVLREVAMAQELKLNQKEEMLLELAHKGLELAESLELDQEPDLGELTVLDQKADQLLKLFQGQLELAQNLEPLDQKGELLLKLAQDQIELSREFHESITELAREQWKSLDFFNGFSDRLLVLMPPKQLERVYKPAKCDAEASRLESLLKDGDEVAANREYHREMCKVVFFTFLTLPIFLMGEILAQVRRMVAR